MRRFSKRSWGAVAALGFMFGGGTTAPGQVQRQQPTSQEPSGQALISVHFPGGTVAEYAELLRGALRPAPANIAISEDAARKVLPPVDLDAVTLGTALGVLQYIAPATGGEGWAVQMLSQDPPAYAVAVTRPWGPQAEITSSGGPPARMLQVFSIKELIDPPAAGSPTPETVLSAVDLALRMASTDDEPPALKFHPDSGLLILDAPPQQVGAIETLLGRMQNDVFRQRDQLRDATNRRIEFETALQVAQVKAENAAARIGPAKQALDRMLALQQSGGASDGDLRQAQEVFMDAKNMNEMAEIELKAAKARIGTLGQPGPDAPGPSEADALRGEVQKLRQQVVVLEAKIRELQSSRK